MYLRKKSTSFKVLMLGGLLQRNPNLFYLKKLKTERYKLSPAA